jgi:hypothetical protein
MVLSAQRGLASGAIDHGWLHPDRERGLVDFQSRVRRLVEGVSR